MFVFLALRHDWVFWYTNMFQVTSLKRGRVINHSLRSIESQPYMGIVLRVGECINELKNPWSITIK